MPNFGVRRLAGFGPRQDGVDVLGGALARADARDEAAVLRMFSATSSGLKMIAV